MASAQVQSGCAQGRESSHTCTHRGNDCFASQVRSVTFHGDPVLPSVPSGSQTRVVVHNDCTPSSLSSVFAFMVAQLRFFIVMLHTCKTSSFFTETQRVCAQVHTYVETKRTSGNTYVQFSKTRITYKPAVLRKSQYHASIVHYSTINTANAGRQVGWQVYTTGRDVIKVNEFACKPNRQGRVSRDFTDPLGEKMAFCPLRRHGVNVKNEKTVRNLFIVLMYRANGQQTSSVMASR